MIIKIMKQKVIDSIKSNFDSYYAYYYQWSDNSWVKNVIGEEPFIKYKEIPDFNLASLNLSKGQIDFENCKIIYDNLKNVISPAMAADERLWAGLCHDYFYSYLRQRWDMIGKIRPKEKAIGEIETRFFIKKSLKAGLFRNTLAKCYWVGKGTYDSVEGYKLLDYIGASSISTKINDIFHNYNFTANRKILKGIIEGMNYFAVNNINFPSGTFLRQTLQYINAVGGATLLDSWSSEEIKELFIEYGKKLVSGQSGMIDSSNVGDDDIEDDLDVDSGDDVTTDETEETSDVVREMDNVTAKNLNTNEEKTYRIEIQYPMSNFFRNKKVGDIVEYEGQQYQILKVEHNS